MLGILLAVQFYIGWNVYAWLSALTGRVPGAVYWTLFALVSMSYLIARLSARYVPGFVSRLMKRIGSYWFIVLQYGLLLLPFSNLAVYALYTASVPYDASIRYAGFGTAAAIAVIFARGSWNAWTPVVRTYCVTVAKKAGGRERLRIAAASDLHLGGVVGRGYLQTLVDRVNELKPDIVLLPGDVLDDDIGPFKRARMDDIIGGFRAELGTYAVLGNHEYYGGSIEEYTALMAKAGIPVLTDETLLVADSFYLIGRKDKTAEGRGGRKTIEALLDGADRSLPLFLLDHQPSALKEAAASGIDLSLSGHTHRGQMAPNHLITRRLFELDWGYKRIGPLHAVVSSGYGTWGPPIRLGSRSEIVLIDVTFAPEDGSPEAPHSAT